MMAEKRSDQLNVLRNDSCRCERGWGLRVTLTAGVRKKLSSVDVNGSATSTAVSDAGMPHFLGPGPKVHARGLGELTCSGKVGSQISSATSNYNQYSGVAAAMQERHLIMLQFCSAL